MCILTFPCFATKLVTMRHLLVRVLSSLSHFVVKLLAVFARGVRGDCWGGVECFAYNVSNL